MVAQQTVDITRTRAGRKAAYDRALRRAIANNLMALELPGGAHAIQSATDPDRGYIVDRHGSCNCKAAESGNAFCQHAALALALRGIVAWPEYEAAGPELEAAPAPAAERCPVTGEPIDADGYYSSTCRECSGLGYGYGEWGRDMYTVTCRACGGSGRKPAAA